ncbi:MAG: sodium:alanine symporter family protein [Clostridia bacterium]|nr:sodium:alanine symporter family protein [Clostridia bacterium]
MDKLVEIITKVNSAINSVVWGVPALILLVGTGIIVTIMTKFFQFTHFGHVIKETIGSLFKKKDILKNNDKHSISQFQALCTALSATIGTGNIAGIALAITMGGPGAVFWMWIAAIFGMMTNYAENVLGIYYRRKNANGDWMGGAMYYLRDGLGAYKHCKYIGKILAVLFSVFALLASFGIGNMGQVASITESIGEVVTVDGSEKWLPWVIGIVLMIVGALVIVGGLKRVAQVNERIVPFMALFYIIGAIVIIIMNADMVGPAFAAIFKGAFNFKAAAGGVSGAIIANAITWGFKRGVFSNEAGLGSSVMVHSSSNVKEPAIQGAWGIFEVFVDTIIVCTCTALVILTSGLVDLDTGAAVGGLTKLGLATRAFTENFGAFGGIFMAIAITLFAFSTVLGWSQYGTIAWQYLFGTKSLFIYKFIFVGMILVSATLDATLAIDLSDTFNGLMAIPNLIGVLSLSWLVVKITKNYVDRKIKKKTGIKPMYSAFDDIQKMQEEGESEE